MGVRRTTGRDTKRGKGNRETKGQAVGAGFTLSLSRLPFLAGSAELTVPVSVGTFGVRWGVQAVGQVLVAVTRTVGHVGS